MSWAGTIVGVCNERRRIAVEREPGRQPLEYFECEQDHLKLDWMIGMTIEASCAGCSFYVGEIEVGMRTGHSTFRLNTNPLQDEYGEAGG
jgi:hypothetical protein